MSHIFVLPLLAEALVIVIIVAAALVDPAMIGWILLGLLRLAVFGIPLVVAWLCWRRSRKTS